MAYLRGRIMRRPEIGLRGRALFVHFALSLSRKGVVLPFRYSTFWAEDRSWQVFR